MRRTLPLIIAFLSGLVMVVAFFAQPDTLPDLLSGKMLIWASIVAGFSLLLGAVSILRVNMRAVQMRKEGWIFSLATLLSVFIMGIPSLLPASWSPMFGRNAGSFYDWMFVNVSTPMAGTMFAMLAFYISSAAYRAFRARSAEATLLLLTASIVMLWRVPMGEALLNNISHYLPGFINTYIMNGVNMSVQRGIIMGAALGAASMSLRILVGIERTYMGRG
ncbi:MAG: hypothetical protein WAU88_08800 [Candidatus Zixiibacteriota bacterium]